MTNITYPSDYAPSTHPFANFQALILTGNEASERSSGREYFAGRDEASRLGHFTDDAVAEGSFEAHSCSQKFPSQIAYVSQPVASYRKIAPVEKPDARRNLHFRVDGAKSAVQEASIAAAGISNGSNTVNWLPFPSTRLTSMRPWCSSTIIPAGFAVRFYCAIEPRSL